MKKAKKAIAAALTAAVLLTMLLGARSIYAKDVTVELDGKEIEFDVDPQIIDGRTMVPLRKIFEELGAKVKWDGDTQTVTARKSSKTVTLSVGSSELTIDKGDNVSETIALDVPAQVVSGRTLVPARAISESFGADVDWDEKTRTVILTTAADDDSWKENTGEIDLSEMTVSGDGAEVSDGKITITKGGDFTVTGTLDGGSIVVSTDGRVKLRLEGASITAYGEPCIFIENADKAYITAADGTENALKAVNSENGAVYAKDNLEIKGKGALSVTSDASHAIKASDNLTVENGNITINAAGDGIHVNDTFKMTGGSLDITAAGDGIDSESITDISGGEIKIKTTATPDDNGEFENSSKGIKAEWLLCVSGGDIEINSASHGIHCQDEIQIDGGSITVASDYEKGISAHGNVTVNGDDTVINITKSTEGIESKNILTVNGGTIKVVSTDDALNATGGNSGSMGGVFGAPGGERNFPERGEEQNNEMRENRPNGGGMGRRMKPDGMQNGMPDGNKPDDMPEPPNGDMPENMPEPPDGNIKPEGMPEFSENTEGGFTPPDGEPPQMNGGERPDGNGGGRGKNMKDCLVINGGYLELYAEDDCLDSNGNLIINGGTIKATNPNGTFSGAFAVIDPDGQTTVSENAALIFAAGSGDERSLSLSQNTIIVYCGEKNNSGDKITVCASDGSTVCEYSPNGTYGAVLISSPDLKLGESYTVKIGGEVYEVELTDKTATIGTKTNTNPFGRGFDRERPNERNK